MVSPRKSRRKICVLFQHNDVHSHAGQKKAQHRAGGTASRNTATRAHCFARENNSKAEGNI